jgi:hypothetical protein
MSETGIHAGGYQRVRDYAETVDRLLLDLKTGHEPPDPTVMRVVHFLEALASGKEAPASVQAIGALLRRRTALPPARFKAIAEELQARHPSTESLQELETVASALDEERAAISARLLGD